MDERLFEIFSVARGVWALVFIAVFSVIATWVRFRPAIMERINERRRDAAAEKAGDWKRVVAERDRYHDLLLKCQIERSEWMRRAVTAEATLQGYGEAHQRAARIVAAERLTDASKREGGE